MTLPIEVTERRLEAMKKIAERHHIIWDPEKEAESTMDEDTQAYFLERDDEERKVPEQFAVLKIGGESGNYCIYADYVTLNIAAVSAFEHVEDDVFAETPVAIYDLDTGDVFEPDWDRMPWKKVSGARVPMGSQAIPAGR